MQKLTPLLDQPPALMKVSQTEALEAFLLVARMAIMTMKKKRLVGSVRSREKGGPWVD